MSGQPLRGYLTGSLDAVFRLPGPRYLVADYKTNWLGDRPAQAVVGVALPAGGVGRGDGRIGLSRCRRCCIALRCTGSCAGGNPATTRAVHLGGVLYLFVRGMCRAVNADGRRQPCGVFGWRPPAELVVGLSDLLDAAAGS